MKKVSLILSLILLVTITLSYSVEAQTKRGWSPQAKGTVIGAGAGAVTGAIIHKRNRTVGGVVGGVVGGATGYAIGKHKDNKNKEAARIAAAKQAEANRVAANRAAASRAAASQSAVAKKTEVPSKEVAVANQYPVAAAYNGYAATNTAMLSNANAMTPMLPAAYLPNKTYGDPSKPYSSSEYRRKSW